MEGGLDRFVSCFQSTYCEPESSRFVFEKAFFHLLPIDQIIAKIRCAAGQLLRTAITIINRPLYRLGERPT
jgi:hypothetical protein